MNDFWEGANIMDAYTAEDMIADGMLVDITKVAKDDGYKFSCALRMTTGVHDICDVARIENPKLDEAQANEIYLTRLRSIIRHTIAAINDQQKSTNRHLRESSLCVVKLTAQMSDGKTMHKELWAGIDETSGPAVHIMLPSEY